MKNLFKYVVLSGVVAVAAACTKDNTVDAVGPRAEYRMTNITIEAQTADAESRTTVEGNALVWSASEQSIAALELWDEELTEGVSNSGDRVTKADCASVKDGKAVYNATVAGKEEGGDYTRGYIAAYPYAAFASVSGTNVEMTLPAEQTPAAVNDIDPAATLLFASDLEGYSETPESLSLWFRHVAAYGRIRLYNLNLGDGEKLAKVVITANTEDKYLSGDWKFDYTEDELDGVYGSEKSNSVTLNVADLETEAVATKDGVAFFFGALPCGEIDSFTVKAVTNRGLEYTKQIEKPLSFNRKTVEAFAVNFDGIDPVLPEESVTKLLIVSGNTSWPGTSSNPFEYLFNGIIADDAVYGDHFHTDYNNPKPFPVMLDFKLEFISYVSSVRYYTRDGNGLPGKFDVLYRKNGQNDFIPLSENYSGEASEAQYDMKQTHQIPYFNIPFDELLENVAEIRLQFYDGLSNNISGREVEIYGLTTDNYNDTHYKLAIDSGEASEYQNNEGIENLFDGKLDGNLYHSPYNGVQNWPLTLTFKLASISDVGCMHYYTRPAFGNGLPGKFDIEYRQAGSDSWIPAVSGKGGSKDNAMYDMEKKVARPFIVNFAEPLTNVTEIRLSIYEGYTSGSYDYVSGSEVEFYGKSYYKKMALTADNFACPFVYEYSLAELCDNNPGTFMGTSYVGLEGGSDGYANPTWDEIWKQYSSITAVWGVYVDIALPVAASDMYIRLNGRNGNGAPTNVIVGKSTDGEEYTQYSESTGLQSQGKWVKVGEYSGTAVKNFRLGVTNSNMGDLKASPAKSMAIAELEVWTK